MPLKTKISHLRFTIGSALALSFCHSAHALPDAKWDNPADDANVLVKGIGLFDAIYGNQTADNGATRADLTQGRADCLMTSYFQRLIHAQRSLDAVAPHFRSPNVVAEITPNYRAHSPQ